jgi:hypothetical protein
VCVCCAALRALPTCALLAVCAALRTLPTCVLLAACVLCSTAYKLLACAAVCVLSGAVSPAQTLPRRIHSWLAALTGGGHGTARVWTDWLTGCGWCRLLDGTMPRVHVALGWLRHVTGLVAPWHGSSDGWGVGCAHVCARTSPAVMCQQWAHREDTHDAMQPPCLVAAHLCLGRTRESK